MPNFLIQRFQDGSSSSETRQARHYALVNSFPVRNALVEDLARISRELPDVGSWVPVGNVPFVQNWATCVGIDIPNPCTYPEQLSQYLHRPVTAIALRDVKNGFIKPFAVKSFDGFVVGDNSAHALEQAAVACALPGDTMVWQSPQVSFAAEYRCYFLNSETLLGISRYDSYPEPAPIVPKELALEMASTLALAHPFSLDVGMMVSPNKGWALVEYNDSWALGLYEHMPVHLYIQMLVQRWESFSPVHEHTMSPN